MGTSDLGQMKRDWDERAVSNARFYIHSTSRDQTEEEFDTSGAVSVRQTVEDDLELITDGRDPRELELLEIGCGIGRMTRHLARIFGKVHGVDVSEEMVELGRQRLADLDNVQLHANDGATLALFPDAVFDVAFSFIVFQHIPFKEVVLGYIRETHRVLKPGGTFKFQVQGTIAPDWMKAPKDTWLGVTVPEEDVDALVRELRCEVLAKSGQGSQYSWYTLRKQSE